MAQKPRVKAPKQRTTAATSSGGQKRWLAMAVAVVGLALAVGAVLVLPGFVGGGGAPDEAAARSKLEAAGCTLQSYPGVSRQHITNPAARPKSWNSFPPTSGPHYFTPAVYGFYSEPVELARALHNLEHGGAYMLYGPKTPRDTVETSPRDLRPRSARSRRRAAPGTRQQDRPRRLDLARARERRDRHRASREVHRRRTRARSRRSSAPSADAARRTGTSTSSSPAEPRPTGVHSGRRGGGTGETRPP